MNHEHRRTGQRVGMVCEPRYRGQVQPAGLRSALARQRDVRVVDVRLADDLGSCDILVARGRSDEVIDLLQRAERMGLRTLNRSSAVRAVRDKEHMTADLRAARLPIPETWIGALDELTTRLVDVPFPLVVKPVFGDNCRDVHLVADGAALAGVSFPEARAIIQRYLPSDGYDLKLYGIGDAVWAVRKPSPLRPDLSPTALPLTATPAQAALAWRCAHAVGLDLYGVDCIDTPGGPVVIEINDFPNYTGVAGADDALADFVLSRTFATSIGAR